MTRITGPSDHSPAELRAIAADLRAGDRPHGVRELLHGIASDLEEVAAAKERPTMLQRGRQ